jgi:hypothetical protein
LRRGLTAIIFIVATLFSPSLATATLQIFSEKTDFLATTGAISATGQLPDLGGIPGDAAASQTVGTVTFTISPPSRDFYIGLIGGDWTTRLPGPDIAISDVENLNADFPAPIYACGFDFVKPWNDPNVNTTPGPSTFTVTLKNAGIEVGRFTFTPPYDQALFYGAWSDAAFNRVEIRETIGGIDNEFWNQFYTGTTPLGSSPPVPLPSTVLLLGSALLGLAGWRRFRKS